MSGEVKKLIECCLLCELPCFWICQWILFGRVFNCSDGALCCCCAFARSEEAWFCTAEWIGHLCTLSTWLGLPLVTRCLPALHSALLTPDIVSILLVPCILWGKPGGPLLLLLLLLCTFWVKTSLALLFLGQGTLVNQDYSQRVWPRLCVSMCHSPARLPLQPLSYKKHADYLYAPTPDMHINTYCGLCCHY